MLAAALSVLFGGGRNSFTYVRVPMQCFSRFDYKSRVLDIPMPHSLTMHNYGPQASRLQGSQDTYSALKSGSRTIQNGQNIQEGRAWLPESTYELVG